MIYLREAVLHTVPLRVLWTRDTLCSITIKCDWQVEVASDDSPLHIPLVWVIKSKTVLHVASSFYAWFRSCSGLPPGRQCSKRPRRARGPTYFFLKEEHMKEYNKYLQTCIFVSRSECRTKPQHKDRLYIFWKDGTTLTNRNSIHEVIKSRRKSGNACYHSVQNALSSSLLSKI
jgi:hypothetical protein